MTNLTDEKAADRQLKRFLELLSPRHIQHVVGRSLDEAAMRFEIPANDTVQDGPAIFFLWAAGVFVQWLYAHGLTTPRTLDSVQAEAEAVHILERSYQGIAGNGYEAALVDFMSHHTEGLDWIFRVLLEAVKRNEEQNHMRWVLATLNTSLSWTARRSLTARFLQRCRDLLPPEITDSPPDRFVSMLPQLLLNYLDVRTEFEQLTGVLPPGGF
jgi:hypothetical protein